MRSRNWFPTASVIASALGLWGVAAQLVRADEIEFTPDAFSYYFDDQNRFNQYGQTKNFTCAAAPKGACGAVAAINSFIFLENTNPWLGNMLTPGLAKVTPGAVDNTDATAFTSGTWPEPAGNLPGHNDDNPNADTDTGYYARFPANCGKNGNPACPDPNLTYVQTKADWFNDHIGSGYSISSQYSYQNVTTDFLAQEIRNGEDVELFINNQALTFYHAITLTGIECEGPGSTGCSISYSDPNNPTVMTDATLTNNLNPFGNGTNILTLNGGAAGNYTFVDGAFSESVVPEPSFLILLSIGVAGLIGRSLRRKAS